MADKLPRVSRSGFELAGPDPQILLLHGYTGTPYDLRPLADYLNHRGAHIIAPLLRGHGSKASALHKVKAEDWLKESAEALGRFDQDKPIVVGGISMGALLAIVLAAKHKNVAALMLFSPALKLKILAELTIFSAGLGLIDSAASFKKFKGEADILDPVARKKSPTYPEMPINGLLQFEKIRLLAMENLPLLSCPMLLAFGLKDSAIDVMGSHQLLLKMSRTPLFSKFYPNSKHVVTLDHDRLALYADAYTFLTEHSGTNK